MSFPSPEKSQRLRKQHWQCHPNVRRPLVTCSSPSPLPCHSPSSPSTALPSWVSQWGTRTNTPLAVFLLLAEDQAGGECLRNLHWGALQHSGPQETIAGLSHPKGSKSRSLAATSGKWQTTKHCHRPAAGRSLVSDALQAVSLEAKSQKASSLLRAAPLGPGQRLLPCTHNMSLQAWAHLTIWSCEEGSRSTTEPSACGTRPQLWASGGCLEYCQCHLEVGLVGQV